ncbi:18671_t:CDS:2, partial [Funneliformis geosporum]
RYRTDVIIFYNKCDDKAAIFVAKINGYNPNVKTGKLGRVLNGKEQSALVCNNNYGPI